MINWRHRHYSRLVWATLLVYPLSDAVSSEADVAEPLNLDPIVVVAGRLPQPLSGLAAQVIVIESDDLRRTLTEDLDGALRYEPGLELQTSDTRFGASSVNIRGIGGNRVHLEVDGVPLRNQFIIGAYSHAGRLAVETERIKRIEVLQGPASVMYGSSALGGVMAIQTWDPGDLLMQTESRSWFGLRAGYRGSNRSRVGSGLAAWGYGDHGMLAAATWRDGHELDHQAADTSSDPQNWTTADFMFRYTWDSPGGGRLRLSADRWERKVDTEIQSLLGYAPRFSWTTSMRGDDQDESRRLSVNYEFSTGSGLQGNVLAFDTGAKTDQRTFEQRGLAPRPVAVDRRFQYSHDQSGIKGFAFQDFEWGDTNHRIGAGAEWIDTKIVEVRDGRQTSLIDGSVSNVILGQAMPVRDFPNSRSGQSGLWLEDTVNLANGRWQVTPAARWDRYDLDPKPDKLWREGNPDTHVVSLSEDRVTPRLGVLFRANQQWSLYGQYAKGFRAPPFEDANIGFDIPLFGFRAIPNPDLRSETSQGIELGVRRISSRARLSIALFRADYSDFIESRALIGRDPDSGDLIFQSRNIDRARVRGIDLRYDQDLGAWTKSLTGWTLKLAGYWAEGDDRQSGMPLNSIAPPQAILGLAWTSPDGSWDFDVNGTFTAAKSMSDIDTTDGPRFATPGWAAIDVTATWRPVDRLEIGLGVFNLADRTYWRWLDVSNLEADDPMIPLLSRPGRSVSAVVRISF